MVNQIKKQGQLNNIVVGGLLASGALAFGVGCYGRQADLIEYCFKPNNSPHFCTPDKRYLMPTDEFHSILSDPLTPEDRIIAEKATRLRILPATNPYKWLWGLVGVGFVGTAYGLSKARERKLIEYLPTYRETVKQSWVLTKLDNWQRERRTMLEVYNDDRKRQYAADLDYQLWQFGADRAARSKQLSMLSPEEIIIFQEQAQAQALAQAQQQIQEVTGQPQALLPGQSLDSLTDPGDKITGEQKEVLASAVIELPEELPGLEVLNGIVTTRRSTLLVGDTGSGKSVTQSYVLTELFRLYPNTEAWAIAQKADSFCGLDKKGRVTLFDLGNPGAAIAVLDKVYDIYDHRRRLPESARADLPPVRLILADWLSINQSLEELKSDETVKGSRYLSKLADIIYNGRELNVCLLVDLQSYNLAAVGLKADRNSRKNFNIVGLGNYSIDEHGQTNESYGVLENLIGDRYIVAEETDRTYLLEEFRRLKPISKANKRPIVFSTLSPVRVALLPDLRQYKDGQTLPKPPQDNGYSVEQLERLYQMEFNLNTPQSQSDKSALNDKHKAILEYLKNNGARTLKQIADSRRLGLPETRELLKDLIQQELIGQDGEQYRLPNN
jgi:hypothetical protein